MDNDQQEVEKQYLDIYSFRKINTWPEIARIEGLRSAEEAEKKYKSIDGYIATKINWGVNETKELKRRLQLKIDEIQAVSNIFNRKIKDEKIKKDWEFGDLKSFYDWYIDEEQERKGCCFYCETEQDKITKLVLRGKKEKDKDGHVSFGIYSSQLRNRGRSLELERKDSALNKYSKGNCTLVCYFCNNDKSNVINGKDYIKYFKNTGALVYRRKYIEEKYKLLKEREKREGID